MMREEFERLIGHSTDYCSYSAIEEVYANLDLIRSKKHIASIYVRDGMRGIYMLRRLLDGIASEREKRICAKMLSKKEIRFPNRLHRVITWYNFCTGEVYDATILNIIRYAASEHEFGWMPLACTKQHMKRNLNSVLCDIAIRHPRLYRPCRKIALKFCCD